MYIRLTSEEWVKVKAKEFWGYFLKDDYTRDEDGDLMFHSFFKFHFKNIISIENVKYEDLGKKFETFFIKNQDFDRFSLPKEYAYYSDYLTAKSQ